MKKIYNAPEASLLCFRAVEDLAIEFKDLINVDYEYTAQDRVAAEASENDIIIPIG